MYTMSTPNSFSFSSNFQLGEKSIDDQHQKLINLMEEIRVGMETGKGRQIIAKVLYELIEYTKTHFAHEEKIMEKIEYPELKYHKFLHEEFIQYVTRLTKNYLAGVSIPIGNIRKYLYDWLTEHILREDKKMVTFLKKYIEKRKDQ